MVKPISHSDKSVPATGASQSSQLQSVQNDRSTQASQHVSGAQEQVALSSKAQLAHKLKAAAHQSPGVDAARVQIIRNAIANNSYHVSPEAIAKAVAEAAWISKSK